MKSIIKHFVAGVCAIIFSAPVFAEDYEHTIDYLMFQGYEYYGISATVETNTDTVEGMTLYVAIYNTDGRLLEVSTLPLDQNEFGERKVYRLKVTTVLDENMTVKAMIMKDLKPYAEAISVKYDKKYNSGSTIIIPDADVDDIIKLPVDEGAEDYTGINKDDVISRIPTYPTYPSAGKIEVTMPVPGEYEPYQGEIGSKPISSDKYIFYIDENGCIVTP